MTTSLEGRIVGPYRLGLLLAEGGQGAVYEALDAHGRSVVFKAHQRGDGEAAGLAELDLLGWSHPALAACLDGGRLPGTGELFTVAERVEGPPLAFPLSLQPGADRGDLALRLLAGLSFLHEGGRLHRDIKEENVLLESATGRPVLLDFGLSCPVEGDGLSATGGTPRAMAPELFKGGRASVASDLWAAGLLLAEAFTGERLFSAGDAEGMAAEREAFEGLSDQGKGSVSNQDLAALLDRLLDPDPAARPDSARAAMSALAPGREDLMEQTHREALTGSRGVALAAYDPVIAGKISAARENRVWIDPLGEGEWDEERAVSRLLSWASVVEDPTQDLAARMASLDSATSVGNRDLMALVTAFAGTTALTFPKREGQENPFDGLEAIPGLTLHSIPSLDATEALTTLQAWIGESPLLEERLKEACPKERPALAAAFADLQTEGVVRLGTEGTSVDEVALRMDWPFSQDADGQEEEASPLFVLLALGGLGVTTEDLDVILDVPWESDLEEGLARGLIVSLRSGGDTLFRLRDGRARAGLLARSTPEQDLRRGLARRFLKRRGEGEIDEATAAAVAEVLSGSDERMEEDDADLFGAIVSCAECLRRCGRLRLAARLLRRGLQGAGAEIDRVRSLVVDLVDILIRAHRYDEALGVLAEARPTLGEDGGMAVREARVTLLRGHAKEAEAMLADLEGLQLDKDDRVLGLQVHSQALQRLGKTEPALTDAREALRILGNAPHRRAMALLEWAGVLARRLGNHDDAVHHFERCLEMARDLGQELLVGTVLHNLGFAVQDRGEKRRGLSLQEEAVERMEKAGDLFNLANALNGLGAGWLSLGDGDGARQHLARALDLAQRLGESGLQAQVLNNLGRAYAAEGRWERAEELFAKSMEQRVALGDTVGQAAVALTRGPLYWLRGAKKEASADLHTAREALEGTESLDWHCEADLLEARLALSAECHDDVVRCAQSAQKTAEQAGWIREGLLARDLLARAGSDDLASIDAEQLEPGPWLADLLFTRSQLRDQGGDAEGADDDLAKALSILGESPDGSVEARGLVVQIATDFRRLEAELSAKDPHMARTGVILSRLTRNSDRAATLIALHGLGPLETLLENEMKRLEELQFSGDLSNLAGLADRIQTLERLRDVSNALNTERDTQGILDLIIDSAIELTGAARGFLILFDGQGEEFRAARNITASTIENPEFQISHSVARKVVEEGKPLCTANAIEDSELSSAASITELKLLSILCVPLIFRTRTLGAIYLDHPQVVSRFSDDHLQVATALAEHAAIALENARLGEGLETTNQQLRHSKEEIDRLNDALEERLAKRETELEEVKESLDASQKALALRFDYSSIVTVSPRVHEVLDLLDRVTDTDYPIIITGESGTGKELAARAVHFNGQRKKENFLTINCAAIAEPLIESELFGTVKGAFTGADKDRKGLFDHADGGSLFLDEIGDMSLAVQKRLLRVLQEGEFLPVGGRQIRKVDVRIICATHRDLKEMIGEKLFRDDLYYRLAVAQVHMPALRERVEDIVPLVQHFLEMHGNGSREIDPEALVQMQQYSWPGNVRQLENLVMNLLLVDPDGKRIGGTTVRRLLEGFGDLGGSLEQAPESEDDEKKSHKERMDVYERQLVHKALEKTGGNKAAASREMGVSVRTFYKMLDRLGLSEPDSSLNDD